MRDGLKDAFVRFKSGAIEQKADQWQRFANPPPLAQSSVALCRALFSTGLNFARKYRPVRAFIHPVRAFIHCTIDTLLSIGVCERSGPSMATVDRKLTKRTCSTESTSIPTKTRRFRRIVTPLTTSNRVAATMDFLWRCSVEFCGRGSQFDHFRAARLINATVPSFRATLDDDGEWTDTGHRVVTIGP